jgi:hypothetical protein
MRIATTLTLVSTCAAATIAAWPRADQPRTTRTTTQTLQFAGSAPHTVDVRTVNGSSHVSAYRGSTVELTTRRSTWASSDEALREADRSVRIDVRGRSTVVSAIVRDEDMTCGEHGFEWSREPDYEVRVDFTGRVPDDSRIHLCAINGGDITVDGTSGDFDVSNVNGGVAMHEVRGSGRASTVNGPLTVLFAANPLAPSQFHTVNGSIQATFAGDLAADLRMKTFNGDLYTDYDVAPLPATVDRADRQGVHIYRANAYTVVRAGRGGPELTFETVNGDVRILRRAR